MSTLNVTIVQSPLSWHDAEANRATFSQIIGNLTESTDIIVLPEMFTTGFSMDAPDLAESTDGPSAKWMQQMAKDSAAAVCGSLIIVDHGEYFNRFFFIQADGVVATYDKRHLFRLADEQHYYSQGGERIVFEHKGFRICPMICYDLRFPIWSRNRDDYDLLIYVANWPSRRQLAWDTLLRARAIENLAFVAGVNRTGRDGNDLPYEGGSTVIDFKGEPIANLGNEDGVATVSLNIKELETFRERFAFQKDADAFELKG